MTLITLEGACDMKMIEYAFDTEIETSENGIDTPETIAQIMVHNARLKELQRGCDGKPVNLLASVGQ